MDLSCEMDVLPRVPTCARSSAGAPSFSVHWASTPEQVAEAQRLRFRVFVDELGARLKMTSDVPPAHDIDAFDPFCDHLLVSAQGSPQHGSVVATCRVLTPAGARRAGGLYTSSEFDLDPLRDLLPRTIEMGRVCIDPAWRNGLVVMAMWRAVGERMAAQDLETMLGCCSVTLSDGGGLAGQLWHRLKSTHLVQSARRVRAREAFPLGSEVGGRQAGVPTLMKGYLRCGGRLLGPPALDRAFNTADFPMIMHLGDLPVRYSKRVFAATE